MLRLDLLYTPLDDCVSVDLGPIDPDRLAQLDAGAFDDAPVLHDGKVLGVVATVEVHKLYDRGSELTAESIRHCDRASWLSSSANTFIPPVAVLEVLQHERCTFVCDPPRTVLELSGRVRGFLTISDLNRHSFCAALYSILAALEAQLADSIRNRFEDPWDWIKGLSEEHQVRILGFWDLSRRSGLDVGPVAASTLTNLIAVVGQHPDLVKMLGFTSKSAYEKAVGCLPGIRNSVMHPARPLIGSHTDVGRVLRGVRTCIALHDSLAAATR